MDKYEAILKAMTPEQRKSLEASLKVLENSKNPKVRAMVKRKK